MSSETQKAYFMSFAADVKDELYNRMGRARHCRLSEMSAVYHAQGAQLTDSGIIMKREPDIAVRKFFTILQKAFNIDADYEPGMIIGNPGDLRNVCLAMDISAAGNSCCRRAFLRGAFLCTGTVSDPSKSYHLEFVCRTEAFAGKVSEMLRGEGIRFGRTVRNGRYVLYIKDAEMIVELLGGMEAGRALLTLENERALRDFRGNINRRVNLETANIGKAVTAASKQIDAIREIMENGGGEELPPSLREIARLRIENPEATLEELGQMLVPPVGKSGVNHRLRRLLELGGRS